jgi:hypothetical protein
VFARDVNCKKFCCSEIVPRGTIDVLFSKLVFKSKMPIFIASKNYFYINYPVFFDNVPRGTISKYLIKLFFYFNNNTVFK